MTARCFDNCVLFCMANRYFTSSTSFSFAVGVRWRLLGSVVATECLTMYRRTVSKRCSQWVPVKFPSFPRHDKTTYDKKTPLKPAPLFAETHFQFYLKLCDINEGGFRSGNFIVRGFVLGPLGFSVSGLREQTVTIQHRTVYWRTAPRLLQRLMNDYHRWAANH